MGPGSCYRRPAEPVNTACVIRIEDVRRVWEEGVGGGVPFGGWRRGVGTRFHRAFIKHTPARGRVVERRAP